jgi:acyl CoA:acetate/3-ketoacid CoA transferase beta subunit
MSKEIILRRTAKELEPDSFVNLGIGLPTGVAAYVSPESGISSIPKTAWWAWAPSPRRGWKTLR